MKSIAVLSVWAAALTGCVTPMQPQEIEDLTTCRGKTIADIRKNLLLAGYEVQSEGTDYLSTGFRQISGYGASREMQRINVIEASKGTFRFRVVSRRDGVESVPTGSTTQTIVVGRDGGQNQQVQNRVEQHQLVQTSNESDLAYYVEYRGNYEATHSMVCGN
jgi:hypothetical protein